MAQARGLLALGGKKAPVPVTKGPVAATTRATVTTPPPVQTRTPAPTPTTPAPKPMAYADQRDAKRREMRAAGATPEQIRAQIDAAKAAAGPNANKKQMQGAVLGSLNQGYTAPAQENPPPTTGTTPAASQNPYGLPYNPNEITDRQQGMYQDVAGRNMNNNTINTSGPYGNVRTVTNPDGSRTQVTDLDPNEQGIQDSEQGFQKGNYGNLDAANRNVQNTMQNPFNFDFNSERSRLEDSSYDTFARRNEPRFQQEKDQFEQDMANRGIPPGSELYTRLQKDMSQNLSDSRLDARQRATEMAGQELSRSYGISRDSRKVPFEEMQGLYAVSRGEKTPQGFAPGSYNEGAANFEGTASGYNSIVGGMQENDRNRDWQSGEAGLGREFQGDQARKDREFARRQARLDREQRTALANKIGRGGGGGGGESLEDFLAKQEYLAGLREQERQADIAAKKKAGGDPLVNAVIGAGGAGAKAGFTKIGEKVADKIWSKF